MNEYTFFTNKGDVRIFATRLDRAIALLRIQEVDFSFTSPYYHLLSHGIVSSRILPKKYRFEVSL